MGFGSGIWKQPIPDPGSRVKRAPDSGSGTFLTSACGGGGGGGWGRDCVLPESSCEGVQGCLQANGGGGDRAGQHEGQLSAHQQLSHLLTWPIGKCLN
jgi:hypothetical protein